FMIKHKDGGSIRQVLKSNSTRLINVTSGQIPNVPTGPISPTDTSKLDLQYQGISLITLLATVGEDNGQWLSSNSSVILQMILIPSFQASFENGDGDKLIGGPPAPEQDNEENIISVFINRIIDPDNPFATSDAVRILLLQFSSLLVEQASPHIHDAAN
ncbi:hypothetical protein LOTGIDRAFT_176729, partial [Lottia gigantea]